MSTKTVKKETAKADQEPKKVPTPEAEPKYLKEKLRQYCLQLFDIETCIFDGAFYGVEGDYFTKDEAQAIINDYLKGGN